METSHNKPAGEERNQTGQPNRGATEIDQPQQSEMEFGEDVLESPNDLYENDAEERVGEGRQVEAYGGTSRNQRDQRSGQQRKL